MSPVLWLRPQDLDMSQRLLIVEDDIPLQQMLVWEFEDLGYQVTAASSCRQAREQAAGGEFDLALLDYQLPDGSGIELLQTLRALYPAMPVILTSAQAAAEAATARLGDPKVEFLGKPVNTTVLHRRFQTALGH